MNLFNGEPNKIALQSQEISLTYSDLKNYSESLSDIFNNNCVYGLAAFNDIGTALIYLSLVKNNCTFLIFDPSIVKNKNNFINEIGIKKIFSSRPIKELEEDHNIYERKTLKKLEVNIYQTNFEIKKLKISSPSILLNTSGSSGIPKVVRISYQNLISNTDGIIKSLNLTDKHRSISILPLFYTYGLSILNTHMFTGGTFFLTENSILQKPFEEELNFFKPNIFSGVPSTFQILKRMSYTYIRQPFIEKITQAGGALDTEIQSEILRLCSSDKDFYVMYGQTEATARITCFNLRTNPKKLGSVGKPLNNLSIEISDRDQSTKIGRICVSGPSITNGYVSNFSELAKEPLNRKLDTGDLGYLDSDGFLFITGRSSRFCKINGKRYNLDVIEKEFNASNLNKISAVSDDNYLFLFSIAPITKKSMKIRGIHPTQIKLIILDKFPLKANGKIDYLKLSEIAKEKNYR